MSIPSPSVSALPSPLAPNYVELWTRALSTAFALDSLGGRLLMSPLQFISDPKCLSHPFLLPFELDWATTSQPFIEISDDKVVVLSCSLLGLWLAIFVYLLKPNPHQLVPSLALYHPTNLHQSRLSSRPKVHQQIFIRWCDYQFTRILLFFPPNCSPDSRASINNKLTLSIVEIPQDPLLKLIKRFSELGASFKSSSVH